MKKMKGGFFKLLIISILMLSFVMFDLPTANVKTLAENSNNEVSDTVEEMMNPTAAPEQFERASDPYGKKGLFNLSPQNELAKIFVGGARDSTNNDIIVTEGMEFNETTVNDYSNAGDTVLERYDGLMDKWSYIQAVGFDPNKTGRDTHIAYIGFEPNSKEFRLNVINAVTGKKANSYKFIAKASWLAEADGDWIMQFNVSNYLSIAAGDFDNDERETVVVYAAADSKYSFEYFDSGFRPWKEESKLSEYYFSESANTIYHQASSNSLLHWSYFNLNMGAIEIDGKGSKLAADLAVGDFDGDNIDDLAVVSYVGKAAPELKGNHFLANYKDVFAPYIGIALGRGGGSHIVNKTSNNSEGTLGQGDEGMTAPSVAAGDIDGDGMDEVIVAGYGTERTLDGSDYKVQLSNTINIIGFNVTAKGGVTTRSQFFYQRYWPEQQFSIYNKMTQDMVANLDGKIGSNKDDDDDPLFEMFPQFALECVATNGQNAPEEIFLNGTFAKYNDGKLFYKFDDQFFQKDDSSGKNMDVEFSYITNLAVGVFDENPVGREQIAYTVYQKDSGGSIYGTEKNADDYSVMVGISGGSRYGDKDSKGNSVSSTSNNIHTYGEVWTYDGIGLDDKDDGYDDSKSTQEFYNTVFDYTDTKNILFVSLDIDNDGVNAIYTSKSYAYTNPSVITVLQAAPYYEEFGYLDDGATSYTFTTSYTIGQSESQTSSMSIGAKVEVQAVCVKTSINTGYSESWSESFTSAFSEEYSTTFTATREHLVVIQRTPVINYFYQVQKTDGTFSDDNYITIAVPCEPVYTLLSIEEYNNFVNGEQYTSSVDEKNRLKPITSSAQLGTAGIPSTYKSDFGTGDTNLSASLYEASSSTGHITSSYGTGTEETIEQSTTSGFYFDSEIMAGGGAFNVEAWGGVSMSTTNDRTQGQYKTTASSTSVSGTVSNLGESGFPKQMLDGYAFNWKFGCWQLDLGVSDVYAYGYSVKGAAKEVVRVKDISATVGDTEQESVFISWGEVDNANKYNVYLFDNIMSAYTLLGEVEENSYTYLIDEDEGRTNFSFVITAVTQGKESIYSEIKSYYRRSYGMSAYDLAVENGFEGSVEEWLESLVGANGNDGVSVSSFYYNNENELIAELTNGTVFNLGNIFGMDGENGLTPYIDENGNWCVGEMDTGISAKGEQGVGIKSVSIDADGNLIIVLTDDSQHNAGKIAGMNGTNGADGQDGKDGLTPHIGENGNWWIGDEDLGVPATAIVENNVKAGCGGALVGSVYSLFAVAGVVGIKLIKKKS